MNDKYIYEIDTLWQLEKPRTIKFCCGILNKFYGGIQGTLNSSKCIKTVSILDWVMNWWYHQEWYERWVYKRNKHFVCIKIYKETLRLYLKKKFSCEYDKKMHFRRNKTNLKKISLEHHFMVKTVTVNDGY